MPVLGCLDWFLKQELQRTGRFPVGLNGTVVSIPHSEHFTQVSTLTPMTPDALHRLQRFGSCLNPLSGKNCCSAAENTNVLVHSVHFSSLSTNSISRPIHLRECISRWLASVDPLGRKVNGYSCNASKAYVT